MVAKWVEDGQPTHNEASVTPQTIKNAHKLAHICKLGPNEMRFHIDAVRTPSVPWPYHSRIMDKGELGG